jgi:glutamate-1-semialdehyde aminotransferase
MRSTVKHPDPQANAGSRSLEESHAWLRRSKKVVPGCAQTFSKGPQLFVQNVAPNFVARAKGAFVWDVDGNRYIDWINGLGAIVLGHCHPAVDGAVGAQMKRGMSFSLPSTLEVELAERLCELIPCAEMVRFGKNGSDVTSAAVRIARAVTGRDRVACCGYHGWQDWYIGSTSRSRGVPDAVRQLTIPFPYNDRDALARVFKEHKDRIACVIMEPVTFDMPTGGYLAEVKDLCRRNGALLVFDEIVTGFRLALAGAQEYFGVTPDLACFGKGMANGYPLSAIVGRADIMSNFTEVFFSFTHGGEALSLAAGLATIREMVRKEVPAHFWRRGRQLQEGTNQIIGTCDLQAHCHCVGAAPWTTIRFHDADGRDWPVLRSLFQQEALKRGLLTHGNHMLSFNHGESIIEGTLAVYQMVFGILAEAIGRKDLARRLEGPPMQGVFRSK